MDKVRCPTCRGSKHVGKIGGMFGKCHTCHGEGKVNIADKPLKIAPSKTENVNDVIHAVAESLPVSDVIEGKLAKEAIQTAVAEAVATKIDRKKAIFKRKKA